ncbi:MAG: hypothetical protein ACRDTV_03870, partial [Mycobacterium sp.]
SPAAIAGGSRRATGSSPNDHQARGGGTSKVLARESVRFRALRKQRERRRDARRGGKGGLDVDQPLRL